MTMSFKPALLALVGALCLAGASAGRTSPDAEDPGVLPPVQREMRGVWVATVDNIDWPTKPGLPVEQQKREMRAILDRAVRLNLNTIVFQVRPCCDSFYASKLEPWSEYLTGKMGQAPEPFYDPLATWIEESHRRGLELHAWFNPYRARHPTGKSPISSDHISRTRPDLVKTYGKHLWMDPGEKEVQDHSLAVIRDVVKRYDLDGVHIDDYFFPYKEKDGAGNNIQFPDDPSWQRYKSSDGRLSRDDWRRHSVNQFVRRLYETIKSEKKRVRFGISPFGIWRPGHPASVKGLDQYSELYADARKWLHEGWLDYWTPQLYWKISAPEQSYPDLLKWWIEQNREGRHVWVGNFTSRIIAGQWEAGEIADQIQVTRQHPGATGNIHFSAKALAQSPELNVALAKLYSQQALVPASPWLDDRRPKQPTIETGTDAATRGKLLSWRAAGDEEAWLWVVRLRKAGQWTTEVVPGWQISRARVGGVAVGDADLAAVSAVDRVGNEGKAAALELR
jgi:uncharacterized lipoprotein YddW (UPF0748 family)